MAYKMCPNKQRCGSCEWSTMPYEEQLAKKLAGINQELKTAGFTLECDQIKPSEKTSHYRNRMDFVIDYRGNFGLREKGKWWRVIDNHTCCLPDELIIEIFNKIYPWIKECGLSYFDRKSYEGFLRYVVIRTSRLGQSIVSLITSVPRDEKEYQESLTKIQKLAEKLKVTSFNWFVNSTQSDISFGEKLEKSWRENFMSEDVNGFKYKISPNAFFQTNSFASPTLQNSVMSFAKKSAVEKEPQSVLDLYCGSGFFTIPLAKRFSNVVGVELIEEAIEDARHNAWSNNVNPTFYSTKAEEFEIARVKPNLLVLDPPRSGLHPKVLNQVTTLLPEDLIYVSCNYSRFVEELRTLANSYNVREMVAVDMFPQTHHVELIAHLQLKRV